LSGDEARRKELDELFEQLAKLEKDLASAKDIGNRGAQLNVEPQIAELNAKIQQKLLNSMDIGVSYLHNHIDWLNHSLEELNQTTARLHRSSRRLETMTGGLLVLTAALIIFTAASLYLQSVVLQGYTLGTVSYLSFSLLVVVAMVLAAFYFITRRIRQRDGQEP